MASEETRWIVGLPAPDEVNIQIAVDSSAELTPELRRALEQLVQALRQHEVEGYGSGASPVVRRAKTCDPDGKCQPKITSPCLAFSSCRIVD